MTRAGTGVAVAMTTALLLGGCVSGDDGDDEGTSPPAPALTLDETGRVQVADGPGFEVLVDDLVVSAIPDDTDPDRRRVAAYSLADASEVWSVTLEPGHQLNQLLAGGGVLLAATVVEDCPQDQSGAAGCRQAWTTLLDVDSGTTRWLQPGYPYAVHSGGDVVFTYTSEADEFNTLVAATYTGRDATTGQELWSHRVARPGGLAIGHDWPLPRSTRTPSPQPRPGEPLLSATHLLLRDETGATAVLDPVTGDLNPLDTGRAVAEFGESFAGDLVLVSFADDISGPGAAFDLTTGAHLWDAPAPAARAVDCGSVVCLGGMIDGTPVTYGVDWDSGQVRWTFEGTQHTGPATPEVNGGPLLAVTTGVRELPDPTGENNTLDATIHDEQAVLLSPESGEVLLELDGWKPLGADGPRLLLYRTEQPDLEPEDRRTVGGLRLAVADLDELAVHELGTVPDVWVYYGSGQAFQGFYLGCRGTNGLLRCLHDGEASFWRYRTS